ncbi:MAG: hypothetical protein ABFS32_11860, partial [Bacteroidota bacterium]
MKLRLLIFLLFPLVSFAQPYANDWIDFNKEYYKITVAEDGIYRITYDDLNAVGFPVDENGLPNRIQIFHRGEEIAIYVEGDSDGKFDPLDYIEFYGQKNDGTLDEQLYVNPSAQPHKYYNLYSDTSTYFLINGSDGKRMTSLQSFTSTTPDTYYNAEVLKVLSDEYERGYKVFDYTRLTQFDMGEGFTGPRITEVSNPIFDLSFTGLDLPVTTAPQPDLELLLVGRNDTLHIVEIFVGPDLSGLVSLGTHQIDSFRHLLINESIPWSSISAAGDLVIRVEVINDGGMKSNLSVSYAKLKYARETDQSSEIFKEFDLQVKGSGGNVIEFLNTTSESKVYDITDPVNV